MEPTLRVILCPHCRKLLYALSHADESARTRWQVTPDSPPVQRGRDGHFVECRHCATKVPVEEGSPHVGAAWVPVARISH